MHSGLLTLRPDQCPATFPFTLTPSLGSPLDAESRETAPHLLCPAVRGQDEEDPSL